MTQNTAERYTGASVKRSEDPRILTGAGRYIDDVKLPGMLHAAFVRSPLAHGRVLRRCLRRPGPAGRGGGVHRRGPGRDHGPRPRPAAGVHGPGGTAPDSACWRRTRCAWWATRWRWWSPRAVTWPRTAASWWRWTTRTCRRSRSGRRPRPGSPPIFARTWAATSSARPGHLRRRRGRVRRADRVAEFHISTATRTCPWSDAGSWQSRPRSGVLTVYAATQGVHIARMVSPRCLGMQPEKVRVLAGDIGGSFGLKIGASREDVAVAAASRASAVRSGGSRTGART